MWPGIGFRWHLIFCQEAWQSFLLGVFFFHFFIYFY